MLTLNQCNIAVENDENVENVVSWLSCRCNKCASWKCVKLISIYRKMTDKEIPFLLFFRFILYIFYTI